MIIILRLFFLIIIMSLVKIEVMSQPVTNDDSLRLWVKYEGKWGLIDGNEQWIVEPVYANCRSVFADKAIVTFLEDSAVAKGEVRRHAVINDKGQTELEFMAIDAQFLESFETIVFTTKSGKGCMNMKGEILVEPVYEDVWEDEAHADRFIVKQNKLVGVVDSESNVIIPIKYDDITTAHVDRYYIKKEGEIGLIDSNNHTLIEPKFSHIIRCLVTGLHGKVVFYDRFWGFTDDTGCLLNTENGKEIVVDNEIEPRNIVGSLDLFPYSSGGEMGYINKDGIYEIQLSPIFIDLDYFSEGLAVVAVKLKETLPGSHLKNTGYGMINKSGEIVVSPVFDILFPLHNGMAACRKDGKYGFIDSTGSIVIEANYDQTDFLDHNGLGLVELHGKKGMVNRLGDNLIPILFDSIEIFFHGYYLCRNKDEVYFINADGTKLLAGSYEDGMLPKVNNITYEKLL